MIQTDDFSTTASKSGYPLKRAIKETDIASEIARFEEALIQTAQRSSRFRKR